MPEPSPSPLRRTVYYNPTVPGAETGKRAGSTEHGESKVDQENWLRPMERAHGSGPHGWGIAAGLALRAAIGSSDVVIEHGVALDARGRHIVVSAGSKVEIGPQADNDGVAPQLADVLATGSALPTGNLTGDFYLTVAWRETFDQSLWLNTSEAFAEMLHTPWLRLVPVADVTNATDTGAQVVLGRVQLATGKVAAISHERRRTVSVPAGTVVLRRGDSGAADGGVQASNVPTGTIAARPTGGIDVTVPRRADQIDVRGPDGQAVNQVAITADRIVGRRSGGQETIVLDPALGNIRLGAQGVEGDVVVYDAAARRTIVADGGDASLTLGAPGNEGDLRVLDGTGAVSARVDGNTGTAFVRKLGTATGNAIDVDTGFLRVHGNDLVLDGRSKRNNRALVDATDRLVVNFGGDYRNGVDVTGLHLSDHVRCDTVQGYNVSKRPDYDQWITLAEFGIGLRGNEWFSSTQCSVGMLDDGSVGSFWWGTEDNSYIDGNGRIVIRWVVNYRDNGDDWRPWKWTVSWIAFRR